MEKAEGLTNTCPDVRGFGPDFTAPMFACHQSRPGEDFPCAGWLAAVGSRHPMVRLAISQGRLDWEALKPRAGWPELHASYQDVLAKLRSG